MGEVAAQLNLLSSEEADLLHYSDANLKSPLSPLFLHIDIESSSSAATTTPPPPDDEQLNPNLKDSWLPITESRKGNPYYAAFHILNSNIGFQALSLPLPFLTLGWAWGSICLTVAFVWQLYTIILLLLLHESLPGIRYSRYLFLAMAAFGKRMGKVAALFPVIYLSGGTCVLLIITGGGTLQQLFNTLCTQDTSLTALHCFFLFTCIAILIAQLPNLNSMAAVSLIGAVVAISYCLLFWVLSVHKGRPTPLSYSPSSAHSNPFPILNAIANIVFAFRGHNLLLEIQGTLPSSPEKPSNRLMLKGVSIAYVIIAMCVFPLAIVGFWAYGNQANGGLLAAFPKFHRHQVTKFSMGFLYLLIIIHCLSSFQIYAMPVFDNLELRYTSLKKKKCPRWLRTCLRLLFGGLTFFIAVAFPFLPKLSGLLGGMTLVPLTYAYPCFMWVAIKKPRKGGWVWCFNVGLGCFGMLLAALLVAAAISSLPHNPFHANFFKP
ncbi:lysine histidine transporter-like 8 [Senna tora]|uniref:Lysine histidine transporter-like 8 n=1 Tax=Senna tora TaxID=362788 RepID=A0A834SVU3_9FABA|nr:lysine histidine transporter-like 8 [Senna tora]